MDMILRKYLTFVNESKLPDNLEEVKDKLTDELEQYKNFIVSKISWKDNKVFYKANLILTGPGS